LRSKPGVVIKGQTAISAKTFKDRQHTGMLTVWQMIDQELNNSEQVSFLSGAETRSTTAASAQC
jgi:hypothetical protein